MTETIWKYTLKPGCVFDIPKDAKILKVDEQFGEICMWALVNPDAPKVKRNFVVIGTGHDMPKCRVSNYLGTAKIDGGLLVFHVFEVVL